MINVTSEFQPFRLTGSDGFEAATVLTSDTNHLFTNLKPEIWYTVDLTVLVADTESESESRTVVTGFNSDFSRLN